MGQQHRRGVKRTYGIDDAAHYGALTAGGATVAVLACGPDVPYPRAHAGLLADIADRGAVVSECPPGRQPSRLRFLARNRIIAVSLGVQTGRTGRINDSSGSAIEQNRVGRTTGVAHGTLPDDSGRQSSSDDERDTTERGVADGLTGPAVQQCATGFGTQENAALARGSVLIEAAERSGTLATARHASDLDRPLMAVPGPVTSAMSAGCHALIRGRRAACVTSAGDIIAHMPL